LINKERLQTREKNLPKAKGVKEMLPSTLQRHCYRYAREYSHESKIGEIGDQNRRNWSAKSAILLSILYPIMHSFSINHKPSYQKYACSPTLTTA